MRIPSRSNRSIALCLAFGLAIPVLAVEKVWIGNGAWSDPLLWTPAGVPDPMDDIRILSGNLVLGGTVVVSNRLTWSGGTLQAGLLRVAPGGLAQLEGPDPKRLLTASITVGGVLRLSDTGPLEFNITGYNQLVTVTNEPGGQLLLDGAAGMTLWNPSGYPTAGVRLVNLGSLIQDSTASPELLNVPLDQLGTAEIRSGTLRWSGGGTATGLFLIHTNASLECRSGSFQFTDARFSGGPMKIRGDLQLSGRLHADDLRLESGSVMGDCDVSGAFTWLGGHLQSMQLRLGDGQHRITGPDPKSLLGSSIDNHGGLVMTDATVSARFTGYNQSVTLTNRPGATWLLAGNSLLNQFNPSGYSFTALHFHNEGLLRSVGNHRIHNVALLQHGRLEVPDGLLKIHGGGAASGLFDTSPAGRIEIGGFSLQLTGSQWTGPGPVRVTDSTSLTGTFDAANFGLESGSLSGSFEVRGAFHWTGGHLVSAQVRLGTGLHRIDGPGDKSLHHSTLSNAGRLILDAAALGARFTGYNQGVVLTNEPDATLEFTGGARFEQRNPSGYSFAQLALVNEGLLESTGPGTNSVLNIPLHNRGRIQVASGQLDLFGGGTSPGSFVIANDAALLLRSGGFGLHASRWTGPARLDGNVTLTGTFDATDLALTSGDLSGSFEVRGAFHWTGGHIVSAQVRLGTGLHRIDGPGDKSLHHSTLSNAGRLILDAAALGARFTGYNQGVVLTNEPDATLEFTGGARFEQRNPSGYSFAQLALVNKGLLESTGPGTNSLLNIPLHNRGRIQVASGQLDLFGGGTSPGSFVIANDAALLLRSGGFDLHASRWTGPARLDGNVTLTGNFEADLFEIGAGSVSGNFGIRNGLLWTGGSLVSGEMRLGPGLSRIEGDAFKSVLAGTIRNSGSLTISNSALHFQFTGYHQSARLINESGGLTELSGNARLAQHNPSGYPPAAVGVHNSGTFRCSGTGTHRITGIPFSNTGTVEILATLQSDSTLQFEPTGLTTVALSESPLLRTTSTLTLGGTLGVFTPPGHVAVDRQRFITMTGNPVTGTFLNTTAPNPGHVFHYDILPEPGQVTLIAINAVTNPPVFQQVSANEGVFRSEFAIQPGLFYRLESSTDLVRWTLESSGFSTGTAAIEDAWAGQNPGRFFRISLRP